MLMFIMVAAIPLIISSIINVASTRQTTRSSIENTLNTVADYKVLQINEHLENQKAIAHQTGKLPAIKDALNQLSEAFEQGVESKEYGQLDKELRDYLNVLVETEKFDDIYLVSDMGDVIFSLLHKSDFATNLVNGPFDSSALADAYNLSTTMFSTKFIGYQPYQPSDDQYAAFIAVPIFSGGSSIGVFVAQLRSDTLFALSSDYTGLYDTGEIMLAKAELDRVLLVAPLRHDKAAAYQRRIAGRAGVENPIQLAANGGSGSGVYLDYRDTPVISAWRYLPKLQWGMVVKIDEKEVYDAGQYLIDQIIIQVVISLIVVMLIAVLFADSLSRPVIRLLAATKKIAAGDLNHNVEVSSDDEIGKLSRSFNKMTKELKETHEDLLAQSQITSHMIDAAFLIRASDDTIIYTNLSFDKIYGYESGEVIGKPVSILNAPTDLKPEEIAEKLQLVLQEHGKWCGEISSIKKDGTIFYCSVTIATFRHPVYGDVWVSVNSDATERIKAQQKLTYQASHDRLTGLIGRSEFERRVTQLISSISEEKTEHAMCFLDLDQFKVINDTCGHPAGDELLRRLGPLLSNIVRKRDTLARLGGDEFGVLMEHCTLEQAHRTANDILEAVMEYQFFWDDQTFRIGVSIGLVAITENSDNFTDLFKQADAACYLAKDLGRNRIHAYHPNDTELAVRKGEMQWVGRIGQALDENRFCLYAQPIVSLDRDKLKHYELLVRMLGEEGEIIPPGAFLPAAERYNLIEKIDTWVVERAISMLASHSVFIEQVNFISINLSGHSVANAQFMPILIALIDESNIDASKICFEVTETTAISNLSAANTFISALKDLGCRFALDDFGSGLSSFGYLKNLPVDYLKIDGMFVKDMIDDPIDKAMVKSINDIGHVMGMKTIAEFVENKAIMEQLNEIGVDYAQGYGIGKPEPFNDVISQFENI
jgi:diguanylate cyclase (GGDEF)-like protein/PAS domain S-box-containing protein